MADICPSFPQTSSSVPAESVSKQTAEEVTDYIYRNTYALVCERANESSKLGGHFVVNQQTMTLSTVYEKKTTAGLSRRQMYTRHESLDLAVSLYTHCFL